MCFQIFLFQVYTENSNPNILMNSILNCYYSVYYTKKWAHSSHFPSSRYMWVCEHHLKQFLFLFCRSTVCPEIIYNHCLYLLSHYFFSITNFVCLYIWPKETCLFIISKLSCPFFIKDLITSGSEISLFSLKASLILLVAYIL